MTTIIPLEVEFLMIQDCLHQRVIKNLLMMYG
jgi:hypothetical protein